MEILIKVKTILDSYDIAGLVATIGVVLMLLISKKF